MIVEKISDKYKRIMWEMVYGQDECQSNHYKYKAIYQKRENQMRQNRGKSF